MKQIQQKLRSRNGATITYALLLFLVCAVIGSVVLTEIACALILGIIVNLLVRKKDNKK